MFLHKHKEPGLAILTFIVGDETSNKCIVVDPPRICNDIVKVVKEKGFDLSHILETHVHADFLSGAKELKHYFPNAQICCSGLGGHEWTPKYADKVILQHDEFTIGNIRMRAVHTPGHTPEHVVWELFDLSRSSQTPWMIFSGDFLFVGSIGRPDLLGVEAQQLLAQQLYDSVFNRLGEFPDFTEFFPAHGAGSLCGKSIGSRESSTIGYEKLFNPALQRKTTQMDWIADLLKDMPEAPPYFSRMKKINVEGPAIIGGKLPGLEALSEKQLIEIHAGAQWIDLRDKGMFADKHVAGAISLPLCDNFATWSGWLLDPEKEIVLITDTVDSAQQAIKKLLLVGFDRIVGHLVFEAKQWKNKDKPLVSLPNLKPKDVYDRLKKDKPDIVVLDVRTTDEWNSGHIAGAIHKICGDIRSMINELPRDKTIAITCRSGFRASIAASVLQSEGLANIANIGGGMLSWQEAKLPITH